MKQSTVCISLGGTKFQIARRDDVSYVSGKEFHWRESQAFASVGNDVRAFCDAIVHLVEEFLSAVNLSMDDVALIGLPFPGPYVGGRWFSNNLIEPFRDGVDLVREMTEAIQRRVSSDRLPLVRVLFDAQADAGGELYHPDGRLHASGGEPAVCLNLATGVAAAFIADDRVLVSDDDFRDQVGPGYDGGAGQLGRHLWYDRDTGHWEYHYRDRGGAPRMSRTWVRMTDFLSGPALSARLVVDPDSGEFLRAADRECIVTSALIGLRDELAATARGDLAAAAQHMRALKEPVSTAILVWANTRIVQHPGDGISDHIHRFAARVASDVGAALATFFAVPEWARFRRHIVMTGGAGIHFMSALDGHPSRAFAAAVKQRLGGCSLIERSVLTDATQRESLIFHRAQR